MARVRGSAEAGVDPRSFDLDLDGDRIRLMFPCADLEVRLTRAMHHLRDHSAGTPDFILHVWDSGTTGVPMPSSPWSGESFEVHGRRYEAEDGRILYRDERYLMFFYLSRQVVLLDFAAGTGLVWIPDAKAITSHEQAAPLLSSLPVWLASRGKFLVHAAAVGREDGVVLLAGIGGAGKSTTALLSLNSDMRYAGDDYCLISTGLEPRVFGLYGSAKLHWDDLHRVAQLFDKVECPTLDGGQKAVLFVNEAFPAKMLRTAPIRALVLPCVVPGSPTRILPTSPAAGMKALLPAVSSSS